jgi:hypothetical protein
VPPTQKKTPVLKVADETKYRHMYRINGKFQKNETSIRTK